MAGIDHPEKYWIDPQSDQAQQAAQAQAEQSQRQQQEQQALQVQLLQNQIMEIQRNAINDKEELQHKYAELQFKYDELAQKGEIEEAKIIGNATLKLEEKSIDAELGRQDRRESETEREDAA